jgi:hypothetical protein
MLCIHHTRFSIVPAISILAAKRRTPGADIDP